MRLNKFKKVLFLFLVCFTIIGQVSSQNSDKPNIVVIITDQQFADAMSCVMGNEYLNTPNMDGLAEKGVRFTKAYSPNPICVPMRTSMVTGRFPHETGVLSNSDKKKFDASKHLFMGKIFQDAGYQTGYFGKWHIPLDIGRKDIHGFEEMNTKSTLDAEPAAQFIKKKHERPFFAVASFLSPHEICQWARFEELPGGTIGEVPALEQLPPLKENFNPPANETDIMTYMRKSYHADEHFPVGNYTDAQWRRLTWGYYRLIERADKFVGQVVNAIKESAQAENTLVVFLSDHGDCSGSHHWNQKTVFYDESARVPFIMMWEGKIQKGTSEFLVNVGTDMIPTLCEIAGIENNFGIHGISLYPASMGIPTAKREYVISENHMVQNQPVDGKLFQPQGRMVRSADYKYCIYSEGENRESLVDMKFDALEMVNQAENPVYKEILEQHRKYLKQHAEKTNDEFAHKMLEQL
jgi:choline-sulfatase